MLFYCEQFLFIAVEESDGNALVNKKAKHPKRSSDTKMLDGYSDGFFCLMLLRSEEGEHKDSTVVEIDNNNNKLHFCDKHSIYQDTSL